MSANLFEFLTILSMKHTFEISVLLFGILEGTTNTAIKKSRTIVFGKKSLKNKLNIILSTQ